MAPKTICKYFIAFKMGKKAYKLFVRMKSNKIWFFFLKFMQCESGQTLRTEGVVKFLFLLKIDLFLFKDLTFFYLKTIPLPCEEISFLKPSFFLSSILLFHRLSSLATFSLFLSQSIRTIEDPHGDITSMINKTTHLKCQM